MIKKQTILVGLSLVALLTIALKLSLKDQTIDLNFLGNVLNGQGAARFIFYQMRLPAIIAAVGVSLLKIQATFILQAFTKNELADPSALGFHNVAITALAVMSLYIPGLPQVPYPVLVLLATCFVLVFAYVMYYFAMSEEQLNGNLLLLLGIGLNSFFQMIITYIKTYSSEANDLLSVLMQGNFDHLGLEYSLGLLLVSIGVTVIFLTLMTPFRLLQLQTDLSTGLGFHKKIYHGIFFFIMALSIALSLMFGASFPFVAFTAIHTMRDWFGKNLYQHYLASFLVMLISVLLSDIAAHQLFATIIPTNMLLSLLGGIGFLVVLLRRKNGN